MGLGGILRGAKTALAAAGLAAIVGLTGGNGARADEGRASEVGGRATARYEYSADSHTQLGRNQSNNKRLDRERYTGANKGEVIDSVGNYSTKELVKVRDDTGLDLETALDVDREKENVTFTYGAESKTFDERIPSDKRYYGEDRANTHVYLVLPEGAGLKAVSQSVKVYNHKREKSMNLFAMPLESFEFMKALGVYNKFEEVSDLMGKIESFNEGQFVIDRHLPAESTLEKTFDNIVGKIPGVVVGEAILYMKDLMKLAEIVRLEKIEKRFPGHLVVPMPIYQPNGNPFGYTSHGRKTKFHLDTSKVKSGEKARILADLGFSRDIGGTTEISNLDGLEYEFLVGGKKGLEGKINDENEIGKNNDEIPENHPLYGSWRTYLSETSSSGFLEIDQKGITLGNWDDNFRKFANWGRRIDGKNEIDINFPRKEGLEYSIIEREGEKVKGKMSFKLASPNVLLMRTEDNAPYVASIKAINPMTFFDEKFLNGEFPKEIYGNWVLDKKDDLKPWAREIHILDRGDKVSIATDAWMKQEKENVPDYKDYGGEQELLKLEKRRGIQVDESLILPFDGYKLYGDRGVFRNTMNRLVKHQQRTSGMAWLVRDGDKLYIEFDSNYLKGPFIKK